MNVHSDVEWDLYYLQGAKWAATKSKDPSTKVGAMLVGRHNRVIATGYNGLAPGVRDAEDRLTHRETKYALTIHAEENALLSVSRDQAHGATMYVYGAPVCERCMSRMIAMGITRVVCDYRSAGRDLRERWEAVQRVSASLAVEADVDVISYE